METNKTRFQRRLFLLWTLLFTLLLLITGYAQYFGYFSQLNDLDTTKLSFVVLGLFAVMMIYCGKLMWQADEGLERLTKAKDPALPLQLLSKIENKANHVWLAIAYCEKLGLLGTFIGILVVMIGGFSSLNIESATLEELLKELPKLLLYLGPGVGTALITTIVGVVCAMLLALPHHILVNTIEAAKESAGEGNKNEAKA